jgi:hypothetical protein
VGIRWQFQSILGNFRKFWDSPVQSRNKALDRIGHMDTVVNDSDYKFEFLTLEDRPSTPITSFSDTSFGYSRGSVFGGRENIATKPTHTVRPACYIN